MILRIDAKLAAGIMIVMLSGVTVFHLLVLLGIVPYTVVWGGRLANATQAHVLEAISVVATLAVMFVVAIRGGYVKQYLPVRMVTVVMWGLVLLFALNTVGNLSAESRLETMLFGPVTFLCTILAYRLAIKP